MREKDNDKLIDDNNPNEEMKELKVGHIVKGVIALNYKSFCLVSVASVSCILPISEISYDKKPKSLKIGTEIEAVVIKVSKEQGIMLSLKRVKNDPWEHVEHLYPVGSILKRKVIYLLDYGAFIELEPGVKALLHRTEVGLTKKDKMKDYLTVGDELEVKILMVDAGKRRLSLQCDSFPVKKTQLEEGNE